MCGIVGYAGQKQAQSILLNGLARLEYRGYDSCGIALFNSGITIYKAAVRVSELSQMCPDIQSTLGIGHTRWATHGAPCQINAHPHTDCFGHIAVVHNGVINNHQLLKQKLILEGHKFKSETDTEVIPHLIEKYYFKYRSLYSENILKRALNAALEEIEGSYALIVMTDETPELAFARKDSPLVLGVGDGENYIASDVTAILEYTNQVVYLENGDSGIITPQGFVISQGDQVINRRVEQILWSAEESQKHGYDHYMLKEIHEQPRIIRDTISTYLSEMPVAFAGKNTNGHTKSLLIVACGTSYHSALIGKYVCERLSNVSIRVEMASEFNYFQNVQYYPYAIAITQSGETADTLKAMRRLKEAGSIVVAITNVAGSTASRIADYPIFTKAGPEISVAATKSFTAQLTALYCLALWHSDLEIINYNDFILELRRLPDTIQRVLAIESEIAEIAAVLAKYEYVIFIARGINYAIALEGALKLKEVAYIHCEAYAAGEIKHGPFALLSKQTPVIAIVAHDSSYEAMLTNIKEIVSRGAPVIAIVEEGDNQLANLVDYVISVPRINNIFTPFVNTVVVQLLAYFAAKNLNYPIDFPRNLAKSVTVE